ncbi:MAG: glutamine synthetase, partial [Phormidesmis sp. CAN_BIN44]|nr:glutamine synthetase [Phormidesmis sp. CAN_BIN44]
MTGVLIKTETTTDLEAYVASEARAELVKQVRAKIDQLGVQYIYYQFISVTGRVVGKGVPANHWETIADRGIQLVYGATANLSLDRHRNYIGYGPEASELVAIPDPETFCQLPWDKRVARVYCTCFRNREEDIAPGAYLTSDCRGNLKRIHADFQQTHGLQLRHGCEPEMMWLKKDAAGQPNGGVTKPNCYQIDQFEELRPVFLRVIEYSRAMGLDMIQGDHEDAPGQLELNFMFDDALRTCDRLTTYRQICAQVAREFNLIACFMTKPFMGVSASGCHHNLSLWRDGSDITSTFGMETLPGLEGNFQYSKGGDNTFLPVPEKSKRKPGPVGLNCIGGVI